MLNSSLDPEPQDPAGGPVDIGRCAGLKITCVSEVGWWDDAQVQGVVQAAGGGQAADQWQAPWDLKNAAGCCTLIEVEMPDGGVRRLILDAGWNPAYMAWRLNATGADRLLAEGGVQALALSHEHMDHLFGLEAVLRLAPQIPILVPATFSAQAREFIQGGVYPRCGAANRQPHQGRLERLKPGLVYRLFPGAASVIFDLPIMLGVRGEQSLIFNVKDKGLVLVSGCCHQGVGEFIEFARQNIAGGENLHGLCGGLHLAPFGSLLPQAEDMLQRLGGYGFKALACNHCTGELAARRMEQMGLPLVRGSASQGSRSHLCLGNGDSVYFG